MRNLFMMLLVSAFGSFQSYAQKSCAQHIIERELRANDPTIEAQFQEFNEWAFSNQHSNANRDEKIIIPVVFHVIHLDGPENISDAQIFDAMRILNEDYTAMNASLSEVISEFTDIIGTADFEFRLAKLDPDGDATSGIDRIRSSETSVGDDGSKLNPWPRDEYLNIWVTDVIGVSGAAAYAYRPPSVAGSGSKSIDGIIANHRYVGSIGTASSTGGTTLTHEIGHFLGLPHTWGPSNEPGLSTNCSSDDEISDTPNCIGVANGSCNKSQITCNTLDNIQNFMDYSSCDVMFTEGQVAVMRNVLNSSVADRNDLWKSNNLEGTGVTVLTAANYHLESKVVCAGSSVQFFDASTYDPDSWEWTLSGPTTLTSNDQNPIFDLKIPGIYSLELTVSQGSTSKSMTDRHAIIVTATYGEGVPFFEDFADDFGWATDNNGGTESDHVWKLNAEVGYDDNVSYYVDNFGADPNSNDDLIYSSLDFRGATSVSVSFMVAYAQIANTNTDQLALEISTDCGASWKSIWSLSGSALAGSSSLTTSAFTPKASDWEKITKTGLPVSWFKSNTLLRFRFTSGNGNNLYLDNINIDGVFDDVPRLAYPENNAATMNDDVLLNWHAVKDATSYNYQLDIATEFNSAGLISGTTSAIDAQSYNSDTEFKTADLEHGQTYYWRVKSVRGSTASDWSETWSFTVADDGVGINTVEEQNSLMLYPNPVNDRLYIQTAETLMESNLNVEIFNTDGQSLRIQKSVSGNSMVEIDVTHLPSGLYFARVSRSSETTVIRFIKE
ncbi:MAG: M43 family zinc metalloprotease [Flavobacteriales bacterium]